MKQYKLLIDGQPSWTSFFIQAPDDEAARRRAAAIAASYGRDAFTLVRGDRSLSLVERVAETLTAGLAPITAAAEAV